MQHEHDSQQRDKGTPELEQHHIVEQIGKQRFVRTSVPIDYYLHKRYIKRHLWEAGELLFFYWYHGAEKSAYVTVRDPREPKGRGDSFRKEQMEQTYKAAMLAIRGVVPRLMVLNVVCYGEWLAHLNQDEMIKAASHPAPVALARAFGKNKRMQLLKDGLDDLAKHFRLPEYPDNEEEQVRLKELA